MNDFDKIVRDRIKHLKNKRLEALRKAIAPFDSEIEKLEKLLAAFDSDASSNPRNLETKSISKVAEPLLPLWKPGEQMKLKEKVRGLGMNTQEMAVKILSERGGQMLALEILKEINKRWDLGLLRSSLSPQLSRLKKKGIITDENGYWKLIGNEGGSE